MAKIKYQFTLKKKALIRVPKGIVQIGEVESYSDINGSVFVTIDIHPKLPKELIDLLVQDPTKISIVGQPSDISKAELTDIIIS